MNNIDSDKNNETYNCVKHVKVENNDLNEIHTAENNNSIKQNKGKHFKIVILNFKWIKQINRKGF